MPREFQPLITSSISCVFWKEIIGRFEFIEIEEALQDASIWLQIHTCFNQFKSTILNKIKAHNVGSR